MVNLAYFIKMAGGMDGLPCTPIIEQYHFENSLNRRGAEYAEGSRDSLCYCSVSESVQREMVWNNSR